MTPIAHIMIALSARMVASATMYHSLGSVFLMTSAPYQQCNHKYGHCLYAAA